jgi:hypothetical protein
MFNSSFLEIVPFTWQCGKMWCRQAGHRRPYNMVLKYAICMPDEKGGYRHHSEYIYLLLFHGNSGYCAIVSHYYITHTLPALLYIRNVVTVRA